MKLCETRKNYVKQLALHEFVDILGIFGIFSYVRLRCVPFHSSRARTVCIFGCILDEYIENTSGWRDIG